MADYRSRQGVLGWYLRVIVVQQVLVNIIGFIPVDDPPSTKMESAVNLAIPFETRNEPGSFYKNKIWHGFE